MGETARESVVSKLVSDVIQTIVEGVETKPETKPEIKPNARKANNLARLISEAQRGNPMAQVLLAQHYELQRNRISGSENLDDRRSLHRLESSIRQLYSQAAKYPYIPGNTLMNEYVGKAILWMSELYEDVGASPARIAGAIINAKKFLGPKYNQLSGKAVQEHISSESNLHSSLQKETQIDMDRFVAELTEPNEFSAQRIDPEDSLGEMFRKVGLNYLDDSSRAKAEARRVEIFARKTARTDKDPAKQKALLQKQELLLEGANILHNRAISVLEKASRLGEPNVQVVLATEYQNMRDKFPHLERSVRKFYSVAARLTPSIVARRWMEQLRKDIGDPLN